MNEETLLQQIKDYCLSKYACDTCVFFVCSYSETFGPRESECIFEFPPHQWQLKEGEPK